MAITDAWLKATGSGAKGRASRYAKQQQSPQEKYIGGDFHETGNDINVDIGFRDTLVSARNCWGVLNGVCRRSLVCQRGNNKSARCGGVEHMDFKRRVQSAGGCQGRSGSPNFGGLIRSHYDAMDVLGDEETIENRILAYEPRRMIAIQIARPSKVIPF